MTRFDDLWSGSAQSALGALAPMVRDQVEALVRQVCADPLGPGTVAAPDRGRTRMARSGRLTVYFQVDEIGELVYVTGIDTGG